MKPRVKGGSSDRALVRVVLLVFVALGLFGLLAACGEDAVEEAAEGETLS